MEAGYELAVEVPSVAEYRRLRVVAGLSSRSEAAAEAGWPHTLFAVLVRCNDAVGNDAVGNDAVVGMGRLVGDGGLLFQVVDIAVDPSHQE